MNDSAVRPAARVRIGDIVRVWRIDDWDIKHSAIEVVVGAIGVVVSYSISGSFEIFQVSFGSGEPCILVETQVHVVGHIDE